MKTESEHIVSKINVNVFFKEFTFDKNDFYPEDGKKELADNILWLDDLLFVIQTKERNLKESVKGVNNWFNIKVLKRAKEQIKKTIEYFSKYNEIPIKNYRNHSIDISKADLTRINKIIIYMPNGALDKDKRTIKFYESKEVGNIHLFHIEDYFWICNFLITPAELDEYLKFRERLYLKHKNVIKIYPEQYILGHFLNTDDETTICEEYIESLTKLKADIDGFNMSGILNSFSEKIRVDKHKESTVYYSIIKEIAKLKRYELLEFKKRFQKIIEYSKSDTLMFPDRFTVSRTKCGFVFLALSLNKSDLWENTLANFTEIYKYKRKLDKCLGVVVFKKGDYYDINWAFINYNWIFNRDLEDAVNKEKELEIYGNPVVRPIVRYKFE